MQGKKEKDYRVVVPSSGMCVYHHSDELVFVSSVHGDSVETGVVSYSRGTEGFVRCPFYTKNGHF